MNYLKEMNIKKRVIKIDLQTDHFVEKIHMEK